MNSSNSVTSEESPMAGAPSNSKSGPTIKSEPIDQTSLTCPDEETTNDSKAWPREEFLIPDVLTISVQSIISEVVSSSVSTDVVVKEEYEIVGAADKGPITAPLDPPDDIKDPLGGLPVKIEPADDTEEIDSSGRCSKETTKDVGVQVKQEWIEYEARNMGYVVGAQKEKSSRDVCGCSLSTADLLKVRTLTHNPRCTQHEFQIGPPRESEEDIVSSASQNQANIPDSVVDRAKASILQDDEDRILMKQEKQAEYTQGNMRREEQRQNHDSTSPPSKKHKSSPLVCSNDGPGMMSGFQMEAADSTLTGHEQKLLVCELCDYRSTSTSEFRRHNMTNYTEEPFKCELCDYMLTSACELTRHMMIHTKEKPFKCELCYYILTSAGELRKHMTNHAEEKPFTCELCDYRSASASELTRHMTDHTEEKSFNCELCDYRSTSACKLRKHMTNHTEDDPSKCVSCDYRSSELGSHMTIHTVDKTSKCALCGYTCPSTCKLMRHMMIHAEEKPFKCELCDYSCCKATDLREHMTIHAEQTPFECELCGYTYLSASKLKRHMIVHTGKKPFKCEFCNYRCNRSATLSTHMRTHCKKKTVCEFCGYWCREPLNMREHMKSHEKEEQPFVCKLCDYRCTSASQLTAHMISMRLWH